MSRIKAYAAKSAGAALEPFEYTPAALGDEQVEIAVDYCGICHSDLSVIRNSWGNAQFPLVPGHDVSGRIVAAGTTTLRALESAAVFSAASGGTLQAGARETDIFITPGFRFRAVDLLLTNFHLPRSTLFMLVAAFSGLDTMKRAYAHAVDNGYRFYSYGDACLLFRTPE